MKKCLVLDKFIYGLVQNARQYWKKLKPIMEELGFEVFGNDVCLIKRVNKNGTVFIGLYFDNLVVTGDKEAAEQTVVDIKKHFNIKRNKEEKDSKFVGVTYTKTDNGILMSQPDTIKKL